MSYSVSYRHFTVLYSPYMKATPIISKRTKNNKTQVATNWSMRVTQYIPACKIHTQSPCRLQWYSSLVVFLHWRRPTLVTHGRPSRYNMEHVATVTMARLDLKYLGKASTRQVVRTSKWQENTFNENKALKAKQQLWAEDLTYSCKLTVQANSQKHDEEQNGPEWRNGKLRKSIWIGNKG